MGNENKEQNGFLKHFAVISGGTFINMLVGALAMPIITRMVDPQQYGKNSIFTMYTTMAFMILCLGLDQALVRYYYQHRNIKQKRALLFQCIKLPLTATGIFVVIVLCLSKSKIIVFEFDLFILACLCANIFIELIYRFSLLIIRLEHRSSMYSFLNISKKILYIGIALFLIVGLGHYDFSSLMFATLFSNFIIMSVSIIAEKEFWLINHKSHCLISNKEMLQYAWPYIFSMGITAFFQAIDKISLNIFCSYNEVGIYASAVSLVHIFSIIQIAFNTLWAPMAVEHYTNHSEDRSYYQKGNQIVTFIMFFCGITLILCKDIFSILLGEKYRSAVAILPCLIFEPIMYTISETTVSGLVFMKKSKMQIWIATGACIANIVGNVILVPRLGCQGAAISTGFSYIIFFSLRTYFSNKYYYINFHLNKFYTVTVIVWIYALFNSFRIFDSKTVIGYFVCILVLFMLYKETGIYCCRYFFQYIRGLKKS